VLRNQLHAFPEGLIKPEIFPSPGKTLYVSPGTPFRKIIALLGHSKTVCLTGTYAFVLTWYSWLKKQNNLKFTIKDYNSSRENRENLRLLTANLMIRVTNHQAALEKAPHIPWLKDFYPKHNDFLIRFVDFLGMNGAWQWFHNGIQLPVLDEKVHPFYGVYFPTRHEHLLLFDKWLKENNSFTKALDIGTGCGVLALMMLKYGIPFVHATDINPNAVYSAELEFDRRALPSRTIVEQAALGGSYAPDGSDLIVFNPPWIPVQTATGLDLATYYKPGFFEDFFSWVHQTMKSDTTLVLLFSNFAQAAGITGQHPIEDEIQHNSRFLLVEKLEAPVLQKPSARKNWLDQIRQREQVELWVMKPLV
jgi:2-polyprenyl-3-methyl-5-hydroxy-6-metoxy-1,4-benzoquinol methylase